jgi:tRNA (adenine-N(1)-)-methyltransferase non-catalytic subunit
MAALLAANSKTFEAKTQYAQEKFLKRKKRTYTNEVVFLEPTARRVAKHLFEKPHARDAIRGDTLARMLTLAEVQAHSTTLVVDQFGGLLLASALQRQGGFGHVLHAHDGNSNKCNHVVGMLDLSPKVKSALLHFPLTMVELLTDAIATHLASTPTSSSIAAHGARIESKVTTSGHGGDLKEAKEVSELIGTCFKVEQIRAVVQYGCTSLLMASVYDPTDLLQGLLPLVRPSGSVVIYSPFLEPLTRTKQWLQASRQCVCVELSDTWCREYQVLTNRTHPLMNTSAASGYILSATKLASNPPSYS